MPAYNADVICQEQLKQSIYVVNYRWHTGIILNRSNVVENLPAIANDFINSEHIEIGWGDKDFYMARNESLWLALNAVLVPTKSVIHVTGLKQHPTKIYPKDKLVEIELTTKEFDQIVSYINNSFYCNEKKQIVKLGKGLYDNSQFYLSKEKYHLFKTCNVWIAKGLKTAGVPINPTRSVTSNQLFKQLKEQYK